MPFTSCYAMKNLLLALWLALPGLAFAQTKKDQAAVQEVEALERQRFAAQVKKDYAALEKLFAADLVYIHGSGQQHNKQEYIESIRAGKSQYDQIVVDALHVRAYHGGTTAVVNGAITITLPNKPDGTANVSHLKYVVVQIKHPRNGWQVVLWQAQKQPEVKG